MKLIALGDIHGKQSWKYVANTQKFDKLVFVGDYFDSFDFTAEEQINNFLDIIAYKEANPDKVIMLIGNHDHHYFLDVGFSGTSGYNVEDAGAIGNALQIHRKHLQMAYKYDDFLFTHAGVGETWLKNNGWQEDIEISGFINGLWRTDPKDAFRFNASRFGDRTGDSIGQTPIWIRPRSLMKDGQNLKKNIIQVVGHTRQNQIDIEGKATGGRYYFIDTLDSSKEYLVIEDSKFTAGKIISAEKII